MMFFTIMRAMFIVLRKQGVLEEMALLCSISTNCSMGLDIEKAYDTGYGGSGLKLNEEDDEA
jgi:hypothetical protein